MPEQLSALSLVEEKDNFSKLLSPTIFSAILRFVSTNDRLNLRLCSKEVEDAIANSNIHFSRCCISGSNCKLTIDCGVDLKFKWRINQNELEELIKFRRRLFGRAIVKEVKIARVNFNTVSIATIERLLEGIQFQELSLTIKRDEYNLDVIDLLAKHHQKKIKMEVHGFALDCATLFSFEPMQKLRILNTISIYSELEFLRLVKQRHTLLEVPVAFTSGRAIRDALESISAYNGQQSVHFSANPMLMDRFLLDIGIRRTRKTVMPLNDFSEFKLINNNSNSGAISPSLFSIEFEGRVGIALDYSAPVRVAITRNES